MRGSKWLTAIIACGGFSISASAHDPGLSSADLTIGDREVTAVAVFNPRDLATVAKNGAADYVALGPEILRIRFADKVVPGKLEGFETDQNGNVSFRLRFPRLPGDSLRISSGIIEHLPFGHREFITVRAANGTSFGERLLSSRENTFELHLASAPSVPPESRSIEFLSLGIRHIVTGYDHLLFLFGLLVVCRTPRAALLLITCFTVAHSLTLALSTFGLVNLPGRFVEATIAASILYVGIENLLRRDGVLRGRWLLTFVFGLVHGLGFASVLHEMGIAGSGVSAIVPLVAFNSGVEIGQLAIAAFVLPIIWQLRRRPAFLRVGVPACSVLVALAGGYWLLERTVLS